MQHYSDLGLIDLNDTDKAFEELDDIIEKIDNIQTVYKNISSVFTDYNENGFLSIDNLQTILSNLILLKKALTFEISLIYLYHRLL